MSDENDGVGPYPRAMLWSLLNDMREAESPNKTRDERLDEYRRLREQYEADLAAEESRELPETHAEAADD